MKKLIGKISIRFLVAMFVVITLAFLVLDIIYPAFIAYAGSSNLKFDTTSIFDDLYGSKDDYGNEFDLKNYPIDKNGELNVFSFVEYGYSYYANMNQNYALYLYLYNPQQINFDTYLDSNVVRMGVSYKDLDGVDVVSEYEDFNIVCVSKTTGDYSGLFYKFKVLDPNKTLFTNAQAYAKKNGYRRYDVAGIFLKSNKSEVTLDSNIGRTYKCSGYMSTYGENNANSSTFNCDIDVLETLDLKVYQTSYLTGVSSAGAYHHNNVSSVYFAIPQYVFDKYGSLWEIYAQWYECMTAPILVTSNADFYSKALANNHYVCTDNPTSDKNTLYDKNVDYNLWFGRHIDSMVGSNNIVHYDWGYNYRRYTYNSESTFIQRFANSSCNFLPLVFYSPSYTEYGAFNVINKQTVAGDVASSTIRDYMLNYSSSNYVSWNSSRNLASELFVNAVDSSRSEKGIKVGVNKVKTNLGDTFDLKSWNSEYGSWWDKLAQYGWSYPKDEALSEDHLDVKPFEEIKSQALDSVTLSSDFLINENDVDSFKAFCNSSYSNKEVPYLFRFAVSDYYSRPVTRTSGALDEGDAVTDSYIAQESVFLDFNIISMTFKGEEDYITLAVMHTPVDVISGVEAPDVELTPGEHLVDETLSKLEELLDKLKNSDFLKALKIIGMVILGIIILIIAIKIVLAFVKAIKKVAGSSKRNSATSQTSAPLDKRVYSRTRRSENTKFQKKTRLKHGKKKE